LATGQLPTQKATRQQTKHHNRSLVLNTIFEHDSISRAAIARGTSLTRTTVSEIVTDLMALGLVEEIGLGTSIGGKSPILLSLVPDSRRLIGLDLGQTQFSGAVLNLRGEIMQTTTLPIRDRNGDDALAQVYEIIDRLLRADQHRPVGIGVGTPGLVNTRDGVVINAVNLDWQDLPLAHLLRSRYELPVYVLNDSQAAAMGEFTYGEGNNTGDNLVVVSVRHGIGAGIVIGGQLFQGDGGGAGEIGHVVVVPEGGLVCHCGNRGCLETVASSQAVVNRVQAMRARSTPPLRAGDRGEITLDDVERAFTAGDPDVRRVVLEAGSYLGLALSSVVGTLNIRKIVLSGDMTRFGAAWLQAVRQMLAKSSLARLAQDTQVEIGQVSGNRVILGASAMLLGDYSLLFSQ
jgi:N-acetylglucosamine repressor